MQSYLIFFRRTHIMPMQENEWVSTSCWSRLAPDSYMLMKLQTPSLYAFPSRRNQWSFRQRACVSLPRDPWYQQMLWGRYIRIDEMGGAWQPTSRDRWGGRCNGGRWHQSCWDCEGISNDFNGTWAEFLPAVQLDDNLARAVVINLLKLTDVTCR